MAANNTNRIIAGGCNTGNSISLANTSCLSFSQTGAGTEIDPLIYNPNLVIDATLCNNSLVCGPDGLSVKTCESSVYNVCTTPQTILDNAAIQACCGGGAPTPPVFTFKTSGGFGDAYWISLPTTSATTASFVSNTDTFLLLDINFGGNWPYDQTTSITVNGATAGTPQLVGDQGFYAYVTPPNPDTGDEIGKHDLWLIPIVAGSPTTTINIGFNGADTNTAVWHVTEVSGVDLINPLAGPVQGIVGGENTPPNSSPIGTPYANETLVMTDQGGCANFYSVATAHEYGPETNTYGPASPTLNVLQKTWQGASPWDCIASLHTIVSTDGSDDTLFFEMVSNDPNNAIRRGISMIGLQFNCPAGVGGSCATPTCTASVTNPSACNEAFVEYSVSSQGISFNMVSGNDITMNALVNGNIVGSVRFSNQTGAIAGQTFNLSHFDIDSTNLSALANGSYVLTFEMICNNYVSAASNTITIEPTKIIAKTNEICL